MGDISCCLTRTLNPPRHETIYCCDVGWGRSFLLPFREEGGGLMPKGLWLQELPVCL